MEGPAPAHVPTQGVHPVSSAAPPCSASSDVCAQVRGMCSQLCLTLCHPVSPSPSSGAWTYLQFKFLRLGHSPLWGTHTHVDSACLNIYTFVYRHEQKVAQATQYHKNKQTPTCLPDIQRCRIHMSRQTRSPFPTGISHM